MRETNRIRLYAGCRRCRAPVATFTPEGLREQLHSAQCNNPNCAECHPKH